MRQKSPFREKGSLSRYIASIWQVNKGCSEARTRLLWTEIFPRKYSLARSSSQTLIVCPRPQSGILIDIPYGVVGVVTLSTNPNILVDLGTHMYVSYR